MKRIACCLLLGVCHVLCLKAAEKTHPDADIRQRLAQTILSQPSEQPKLLSQLAESGAAVVSDVLTAWTRDGVYLYEMADGTKTPVLLEEQQDPDGKARAIRIETGASLKDAAGKDVRVSPNDLTPADTDARLRTAIQQALDTLALSAADPDARRSAVLKLGNSGKAKVVPVLEGRLAKETVPYVRKSIHEAIAMLQLGNAAPRVQILSITQISL